MSQRKFARLLHARVVVLGGSSGLGFATAEGCIEAGASVVIAGSNEDRLNNAIKRLHEAYPDAKTRISGKTCDASNPETLEENLHALFKFATQDGTKIQHVVNTAGAPGALPKLSDVAATSVLPSGTLRFLAPMMIGKIAPSYMTGGRECSITFTGGTLSHKPEKGMSANIGWSAGTEGLVRGLAVDLAPIRVNLISPGAIETELLQRFMNDTMRKIWEADNLLHAIGAPEDTAESYMYVMKDRFITGQVLSTDGGRMLVSSQGSKL